MFVKEAMHDAPVTIQGHHSLADAVVMMENLKVKRLPVLLGARLVGLITDGDVRRHLPAVHQGLSAWDFAYAAGRVKVSGAMCPTVLTTTPETELDAAMQTMLDRRVGGLPVLDEEEHLLGMLTLTDVLRAANTAPRHTWGAVREHMSAETISVEAASSAADAAARLRVTRLRVLPVVEGGTLVGVLHGADLSAEVERRAAAHGDTVLGDRFFLQGVTAADLMRPPSDVVLASVPMRDAVSRMLAADVHGLPVVSDGGGRLLGVVTISDVLRTLLGQGAAPHV